MDLLLTCLRQVLLLAKPRDKQVPDSIVGIGAGDATPSILRPAAEASQLANPNQVTQLGVVSHICTRQAGWSPFLLSVQ